MKSRKRVAVALAALVALGVTSLTISGSGGDLSARALSAVEDAIAQFASRGPGERTLAVLTKTKTAPSAVPHQRALGKIFPPEEPGPIAQFNSSPLAEPPLTTALGDLAPGFVTDIQPQIGLMPSVGNSPSGGGSPPSGGPIFFPPDGSYLPPDGPIFVPPGGGGGGVVVPPLPTPAVPEPTTWAMMILGMALCGASMRRHNAKQVRNSKTACV